ncbi:MAG: cytochrome c556 [Candidatus Azotimanducaceae bacterium]|jgi:cytochrome c556
MKKIILLSVFFTQFAFADAASEIKYRQGVMKVVGGHMQSIVTILKGGIHGPDLKYHTLAMANIAAIVPAVFPEGSGEGKTEALAAIWEDKKAFAASVDKFVKAADGIALAGASGDMSAIGPAIKALGGSCKGCHDDYKEE